MPKITRKPGLKALFEEAGAEETGREPKEEKVKPAREVTPVKGEYAERKLKELLEAMEAFRKGDLSIRLKKEKHDAYGDLADSYNRIVEMVGGVATEVSRVAKVAGTEGKLTERASFPGIAGTWKDLVDTLNALIDAIAKPTLEVGRILDNISKGNLTEKFEIPVAGDFKVMSDTINETLDNLSTLSSEVTRVAKTVGVEGELGGKAEVPGVAGTWKDLMDNVNMLAANLTSQVRNIAEVVTAVAEGDLTKKITVEVKGEILQLKETINGMVDNLNRLASEVSRVAKVAGVEGKLTERAEVPGIGGSWKDIVDTLNTLIDSIAKPVLEVSRIATAMSKGDLTQKMEIQTAGDIKTLVDGINKSVDNLNASLKRVRDASDRVATISQTVASAGMQMNKTMGQIASSIQQIAKGAQTQAEKVSISVKSAGEISNAAADALAQADEVSKRAKEGTDSATAGGEAVQSAVKDMDTIAESVNKTAETIKSLTVRSEQIGKAVDIISDVTGQTSILALNAAIEASRAGEQGRGFAVVAEEVRRLAERTKRSAADIADVIRGVQKDTSEAVMGVKAAMERVTSGKESTVKSLNTMDTIKTTVSQTLDAAQLIAAGSKQQVAGTETVVKMMDEISSIAEQTSSGAQESASGAEEMTSSMEELATSAQELSTMAQNLQAVVTRFKLGEGVAPVAAPAARALVPKPEEKKEE